MAIKTTENNFKLPLIVRRDEVIFPSFAMLIKLTPDEKRQIIAAQTKYDGMLIFAGRPDVNDKGIFPIGTLVKVEGNFSDGMTQVKLSGQARLNIGKITENKKTGIITAIAERSVEIKPLAAVEKIRLELIDLIMTKILSDKSLIRFESLAEYISPKTDTSSLADAVASMVPLSADAKHHVLGELRVIKRVELVIRGINELFSVYDIEEQLSTKLKNKHEEQQREFFLREKMKIIQSELDQITGQISTSSEMTKKLEDNDYPVSIKTKMMREVSRLEQMPSASAEYNVMRTYIETILDLPWWQKSETTLDLKKTKKQLNKDHFGLDKPKERILEHIAVNIYKKSDETKGQIICFVGPPGTGKTSLAKSIAISLGRKMHKIALGGVQDEAEIRGHRRTYIASKPGRIIEAMRKVGVINPLILLDEVDKLSSNMKGDPSSALLEVLDPEQNKAFNDNYVEEDYDLSKVMFIATANNYYSIPGPLLDRMEIIELSSYTELEKLAIAKQHLIPRTIKEIGVPAKFFKMSDEVLMYLIRHYTAEAGVRKLHRVLETLARKVIVLILNNKMKGTTFTITIEKINKMLGPEASFWSKKEKTKLPGIVNGLAWTSVGGDTLPIEVVLYEGKGELRLTGSQKEVMQESANVALGYIKANCKKFGIDSKTFEKIDIHINTPDGATPKDGPSAGVTFTTAIISAFAKKIVSNEFAMTGEITLRGNVLEIGGLKEKSIGAHRVGVKTVFLPYENKKDLIEIPAEIKKEIKFIPVKHYSEIFNHIFK